MIEHQAQITLDQPPERVFDFFVDFRHEPAWNPGCISVEKKSAGPVGVGTVFEGKMKGMGPNTSEIVSFERPQRCSATIQARGAEGTYDLRFTPRDGGTQVEVAVRMQPKGPMRLAEPLMRRMMGKMVAELPEHMRRGIDAADRVRESEAVG
jgi:uncharacterized protein YndB with AHSA1/START domain